MIKAVLFDFDGVLTTDSTGSQSICNYICKKTGLDPDIFKKEYYKYNNDLLYGKSRHEDIWETLCQGLNTQISMSILYESFRNTPIDNQLLTIVEKLKRRSYKIGMVTDNKADRINSIAKYYDWNRKFDIITVSAEVGSGKDQNEIFIKTIQSLSVNADECVFIDNQEKNLIVPKKMGMNVIYFDHEKRNIENLVQELRNLAITI